MASDLNPISIYSAVVSTGVAAWQMYTYFRFGARLRLEVGTSQTLRDASLRDTRTFVVVQAANVGKATTTITNLLVYAYEGWCNRLRNKRVHQAWVGDGPHGDETPFQLDPGKHYRSLVEQTDELVTWSRNSLLYVGIQHTMSGRVVLKRIMPIEK